MGFDKDKKCVEINEDFESNSIETCKYSQDSIAKLANLKIEGRFIPFGTRPLGKVTADTLDKEKKITEIANQIFKKECIKKTLKEKPVYNREDVRKKLGL